MRKFCQRACKTLRGLALASFVAAISTTAAAQFSDAVSGERPGFSSSPIALAKSRFQLEGGYQFTRDNGSPDISNSTLPLTLFRYGVADQVELQLSWAGWSWTDAGGQDIDGATDASVGVKWQLTDADATTPVALFAGASLPIGSSDLSSDDVDPVIGAFWSHSSSLNWFGTLLVSHSNDQTTTQNAVGLSLPYGNRSSGYIEYFGNYGDDGGPQHYLNGGIAYLSTANLQLDVNGGFGLNSRALDFFLGFGFAYRFSQ